MTLQSDLEALGDGLRVQNDAEVYEAGVVKVKGDRVRFYPTTLFEDDRPLESRVTVHEKSGKGLSMTSDHFLVFEVYPAPDLTGLVTPGYLAEVDRHWAEDAL